MGTKHQRGQGSERHLLKVNLCACAWLRLVMRCSHHDTNSVRKYHFGDWALGTGCQGNYVRCITLLVDYGFGSVLKSKPSTLHRT